MEVGFTGLFLVGEGGGPGAPRGLACLTGLGEAGGDTLSVRCPGCIGMDGGLTTLDVAGLGEQDGDGD